MAIALMFAVAGCGLQPGPETGPRPRGQEVRIENGSASDLRVMLQMAGSETMLGRVGALQVRTLRLPSGMTGQLRLVVRPITARMVATAHVSEPFHLNPGERMVWKLQHSPGVSGVPNISTIQVFGCVDPAACW
jgi:hypothetical protein